MALPLGNVSKYEFLTGKDGLPEKGLLEKAATVKRLENSPLGSELEKQTDITKCQYKLFKDQINVISNNKEDGVKTEYCVKTDNGEIINIVHNRYDDK